MNNNILELRPLFLHKSYKINTWPSLHSFLLLLFLPKQPPTITYTFQNQSDMLKKEIIWGNLLAAFWPKPAIPQKKQPLNEQQVYTTLDSDHKFWVAEVLSHRSDYTLIWCFIQLFTAQEKILLISLPGTE